MAEPFKELINEAAVRTLASALISVSTDFPAQHFLEATLPLLPPLELKARVRAVARTLRAHLPEPWPTAATALLAAMPPPLPDDREVSLGFVWWPVLQVVEDFGAHDPATSLPALREMTRRFSAEFAIRPLLEAWPAECDRALDAWVTDPCPHVRRLVSEGTRPRLPWGARLSARVDRTRHLRRLDRLVDDPSEYVRRSVANHLGDVAKDDPTLALHTAAAWLDADATRLSVVRHGLRAMLKAGHPDALALVELAPAPVNVRDARVPATVRVGEPLEVTATLTADTPTPVRVDLVWRWPAARGGWSSRTFRGADAVLTPGVPWVFRHRLSTKPVTTRPTRPGPQQLVLRVLGVEQPPLDFVLIDPDA